MENYKDYLEHHGILGQKWGKRNGPPYPLSSNQMSKREKIKAQKSNYKDIKNTYKNKSRLERFDSRSNVARRIVNDNRQLIDYSQKIQDIRSNKRENGRISDKYKAIKDLEYYQKIVDERDKLIEACVNDSLGKFGDKPIYKIKEYYENGTYKTSVSAKDKLKTEVSLLASSLTKSSKMERAKDKDLYDLDFLEAVQNYSLPRNVMLKEYGKYLDAGSDFNAYRDGGSDERLKKYAE